MVNNSISDPSMHRRRILQLAGSGLGLSTLDVVAANADDDFLNIVSTDPSQYPNISVNLRVDTTAGRNGNLTAENFAIYEEGTQKKIKEFSFSETAIDLVFVFDDSGSMGDEIATMKRQAKALTNQIDEKGINAQYGLVSFRDSPNTDLRLTSDSTELVDAVNSLEAYGGGDFPEDNFDSIETALDFDFRNGAQTIIVDITDATSHYDGDGSGVSEYTLTEVASDLREQGAIFVGVSRGFDDPQASFKVLANKVGGKWYDIHGADFDDILKNIIELITQIYVIQYRSQAPEDSKQEITASVDDPNRGKDLEESLVEIEPNPGTISPEERFVDYKKANRATVAALDEFSLGLNLSPDVEALFTEITEEVSNGNVDLETANSAIKRNFFSEDLAEFSLGVINPDAVKTIDEVGFDNTVEYSRAYEPSSSLATKKRSNLASSTIESLGFVLIGVTLASRALKYFLKGLVGSSKVAAKSLDRAVTVLTSAIEGVDQVADTVDSIIDEKETLLKQGNDDTDTIVDDILVEMQGISDEAARPWARTHIEQGFAGSGFEGQHEALIDDLNPVEGGGIDIENSTEGATEAWIEGKKEIDEMFQRKEELIDFATDAADVGAAIGAAGVLFSGSLFGAPVGTALAVIGALTSISFQSLAAFTAQDGVFQIRNLHKQSIDAIRRGDPNVY